MDQKNWQQALEKTRKKAFGRLATAFGQTELTEEFWNELESILIQGDVGIPTTDEILSELKGIVHDKGITSGDELKKEMMLLLELWFIQNPKIDVIRPYVIIMIGVNGSGKTTTTAKLAKWYQERGQTVLFAAADTYRAAATEQLQKWGQRLGIQVVSGEPGSDPGAVVYSASQAAVSRDVDVLLVDTSGRMHTNRNLMAELHKICTVAEKIIPEAPSEVLLVLDATTGQNGLQQAKAFTETVDLTGVVLAKLDTSARGGIALSISSQLGLPIRYVGIGEGTQDLVPFDPQVYLENLISA
jgi:fused signal recognition particle receptor